MYPLLSPTFGLAYLLGRRLARAVGPCHSWRIEAPVHADRQMDGDGKVWVH